MKKILMLLFATGTIGVASAQSASHHDNRFDSKEIVLNDHASGRSHGVREKEAMIRKINADFDHKVADVNSNHRLKKRNKTKLIRQLNKERAEQIRLIEDRFGRADRSHDNRSYKDHRDYRS